MARSFDVAVVGLGAMGSAAAYHLARRGRRILGLDRFHPPHAFGSSGGTTRIIREAYFEDPLYVPLARRAYAMWDELEAMRGEPLLSVTGALMIGPPDGVLVTGARRSAELHNLPHEMLTAVEVTRRHPALRPRTDMMAVWEPRAGILMADACIAAHLALARDCGADLRYDEPLARWEVDGAGVRVATAAGEYRAEQLLFTSGAWVASLIPELTLPFAIERQVLYWLAPAKATEDLRPSRCPIHMWEFAPRRFFYGFPDLGDGVKVGLHHDGELMDPDGPRREASDQEIADIRTHVRSFVPSADGRLRSTAICMYTNTPDGHFWIDRHPDHPQVLIASPCSGHGFKFAPLIGDALAEWLTEGQRPAALKSFGRR
jgi:sarcosine oxidase